MSYSGHKNATENQWEWSLILKHLSWLPIYGNLSAIWFVVKQYSAWFSISRPFRQLQSLWSTNFDILFAKTN